MDERKIIEIVDSGEARYCLEANFEVLGRMWDNEAEEVVVVKPERERDHACIMIVTVDGKPIEHIVVGDEPIKIRNILSMHSEVSIGFTFGGVDGYTKNTEVKKFCFLKAQKPEDFVPVEPEHKGNLDLLIAMGFVDVKWKDGSDDTMQYLNSKGEVVKEIQIKSGIDNTINNLVNYYLKSETYNKEEVNNLIKTINSFKKEIVDTLPAENIDENTIYLVPKQDGSGNDYYDEYLYINGAFEFIGSTQVNLTDYVKFTDYASQDKAGVHKVKEVYGTRMVDGVLDLMPAQYSEIDSRNPYEWPLYLVNNYTRHMIVPANFDYAFKKAFLDDKLKGTAQEWTDEEKAKVLEFLGALGKVPNATNNEVGGVTINSTYGITVEPDDKNKIKTVKASDDEIVAKTSIHKVIVPANLDKAVKEGLINNSLTLTDTEKEQTLAWLGALEKPSLPNRGSVVTMSADGSVGTTQMVHESATKWSFPLRDDNGCVKVAEPVANGDAIPKSYGDTNYVKQINTSGFLRVYGIAGNGVQTVYDIITKADHISEGKLPRYVKNTIDETIYEKDCVLSSGTPTQSHHVANKEYVDGLVGDINTALESILGV